jgi:lipid-A-disaccharide synthase
MIGEAGHVSDEPLPRLLERLDLALVCSGTASLEVALAGVPHAVAYETSAFNYAVGRTLVKVPHIGLTNLILGKPAVPELIQGNASPVHMANALLGFLNQRRRREEFHDDCERLRAACGVPGVWARTAAAILALLADRRAQV